MIVECSGVYRGVRVSSDSQRSRSLMKSYFYSSATCYAPRLIYFCHFIGFQHIYCLCSVVFPVFYHFWCHVLVLLHLFCFIPTLNLFLFFQAADPSVVGDASQGRRWRWWRGCHWPHQQVGWRNAVRVGHTLMHIFAEAGFVIAEFTLSPFYLFADCKSSNWKTPSWNRSPMTSKIWSRNLAPEWNN